MNQTLDTLTGLTIEWGVNKQIIGPQGKGTSVGQAIKMMEEATETQEAANMLKYLLDAGFPEDDPEVEHELHELKDGIGDTFVTLVLLANMHGWTIQECVQTAYDVISKRTGKMVDGIFVKDGKENA